MARVREFTVKFVITEEIDANGALQSILSGSGKLDWPDYLVGVEYITDSEITREATLTESESMGWDEDIEETE